MKEECGIFGVFGHKDAAELTYLGLYALQHRGQESTGIVTYDNGEFKTVKNMGLVSEVFNPENLSELSGDSAIGHVRYSTTGTSNIKNAQPFLADTSKGTMAIAHNGNIVNASDLHDELKSLGSIFQSTTDSEIIVHLLSKSRRDNIFNALIEALMRIRGAYSLVVLGEDHLIAARDEFGFRPLCLGRLDGAYVLSSETCALDLIQAEYIRDIEPGEVLLINKNGLSSLKPFPFIHSAYCIFELIYFARPDSLVFGQNVHSVRKRFGARLANEHPVSADLIMAIPDSGNSAALGYAQESVIPFEFGMTRNHYIGRTFIEPNQKIRDFEVKIKLNPIKDILKDKRVVIVDDSIVRGTTSKQRVQTIRHAGAKEVHMRISSPPIINSCYFGIDTPKKEKLIASSKSIEEIREYIGADSLGYLSIEGMLKCVSVSSDSFCTACFSGNYPMKLEHRISKLALESKHGVKNAEDD
ncbi:MAG: amidophosphoribosyltransferase [Candidatus Saganbacteria bacterium]|nr:amidophosphoribosyltransferase [Candidatus Saganbacteria bacterium]